MTMNLIVINSTVIHKLKSHARNFFKEIPGLIGLIRFLRSLDKKVKLTLISRAITWANASPSRRALIYEKLLDDITLADHKNESYVIKIGDKFIGRSLYSCGEFDFSKFLRAFRIIQSYSYPTNGLTLIDAGANIGSICIPAVRRGYVSNAIALEPDQDNVRLLRINTILNRVEEKIEVRHVAVGSMSSQVVVRHSQSNFGDHRVDMCLVESDEETVPMITLDSISEKIDLSKLLVWMDIQGYEGYALLAAKQIISSGVPLVTEFSVDELENSGCYELFLSVIISSSYKIFFDLSLESLTPIEISEETLRNLGIRLQRKGTFTDLLFLK